MTKKELLEKIKLLNPENEEQRNKLVCALVGHSKIQHAFLGQFTCGRCGEIMGDALAGCYCAKDVVIIGHNCKTCKENYKKLTWKDKLFAPDPFK